MCGIVGIINKNKKEVSEIDIKQMLKKIKHRGPDGEGIYIDGNVGCGHVLLKIQDVSEKSKQPFCYKDLVLSFNGEIYNFLELKMELVNNGYTFDTIGDTEVLIKMLDCYGLDNTLNRIEGCYAFSLYNKNTKELYLVRDKFGIKPLYYYNSDEELLYASEIKSILEFSKVPRKFNIDQVLISLNCKLWMDPHQTLFKDIYSIKPGHYVIIKDDKFKDHEYHSFKFSNQYNDSKKLVTDFEKEFTDSVRKKLLSQVPIAAFLSGGLDSSIVCKLLNDYSNTKLNTYTICYDFDNDFDLNHANILAKKEGFKNHNILIKEDMYNIDVIDKVIYGVEEILIDKVYIPMYFNYKAAKDDGFTVVVSGQGSDEVWLGYVFTWKIFQFLKEKYNHKSLIYDYYIDNMIFKDKINVDIKNLVPNILNNYLDNYLVLSDDEINSYGDLSLKTILHDLLIQEDKIAMMNSIESRVPFVDNHRIVELAYKSNSKIKLEDGREKYIVRQYAKDKLPDSIVNREKYPFPEPPKIYNEIITKLCNDNWDEICKSNIIRKLIKSEVLDDVNNFTEQEQWWLLVYWRFEKVFELEVA
ncbi:MAG: asparagine synthase (glutamine-hydrolyzing) [Bacilli bacterium]|nr:asparagine synthase (glutamine-hydrolyzing) [Bacilli bacterium]